MKRLLLILILLVIPMTALADLTAYFFDVGNADATLIEADGKYMLIDAGTNAGADELVQQLKDMGITRLEYVVGTHPHEDHIGGLDDVIYNFDVGALIMPDVSHNTATYYDVVIAIETYDHEVYPPSVGDTFQFGGAVATVLSPARNDYAGLNFFSVVLRVEYDGFTILLMGDAEDVNEFEMLNAGHDLKASVLKVGHHGSSTSTTQAFLDAVQPEAVVISCGAGNQYGHPHDEVMDRLAAYGCQVYRTDEVGTITVTHKHRGRTKHDEPPLFDEAW